MIPPIITHFTGRNIPGLCALYVVLASEVASMPDAVNGTVPGDITLTNTGGGWRLLRFDDAGGTLTERWIMQRGVPVCAAEIKGTIAQDHPSRTMAFWPMMGQRYVVLARTQNRSWLVLGTKTEPAMVQLRERRTGDGDGRSDRNDLAISITVQRNQPVPFYGGTPPQ